MTFDVFFFMLHLVLLHCTAFVSTRVIQTDSISKSIRSLLRPRVARVPIVISMHTSSASLAMNKAAVCAISKLIGTCGIGVLAGKAGILDQSALSVLSKLIFTLFQPCLLFINVASTAANSRIGAGVASLYWLPIAAGLQIVLGYGIGRLMAAVVYRANPNSEEAKQLLVCTTFSNSGPLPLTFADGLFARTDKRLASTCAAYISMYLLGWSPLFWLIAPAILKDEATPGDAAVSPTERRKALLRRIISPPVLGASFGLVVGTVPSLTKLLIPPEGLLNPLFESIRTIGSAYLPTGLMVLAGSLCAASNNTSTSASTSSAKPGSTAAEALIERSNSNRAFALQVACVYIARFLLMPSAAFALVGLVAKYVPSVHKMFTQDPMLLLVLLLQTCMPSAQNTTVIYQLQKKTDAAGRLAKVLMVMYVLGIPAISYWLIRILSLTGLGA